MPKSRSSGGLRFADPPYTKYPVPMPRRPPTLVLAHAAALILAASGLSCGSGSRPGNPSAPVPANANAPGVPPASIPTSAPSATSTPPPSAPGSTANPSPATPPELVGPPFRPSGSASALDPSAVLDALERQITEGVARARESAVALEYSADGAAMGDRRMASGVVINTEGDIISVRIDAPSSASVAPIVARVASGRRLTAQWVASDDETGLTLLKIPPNLARPAAPAPRGPRVGIPVLVVGNPFGLAHSVGRGYVAGLNRRLELGPRQLGGLIQIDASLHPGDSGALLADLRGGWLGLIRSGLAVPLPKDPKSKGNEKDKEAKASRERETDHDLGFAITARDALWVSDQLRTYQRVDRAYLGVIVDEHSQVAGEPEGAVLGQVLADTPAGRAGLFAGDRVVAMDGRPVRSRHDFTDRLDRTPAEAEVTLDVVRGTGPSRQRTRVTAHTTKRPPMEPAPATVASSGPSDPPSTSSSASPKAKPADIRFTIPRDDKSDRDPDAPVHLDKSAKPKDDRDAAATHDPMR
jgi:serine protease Do